LVLTKEKEMALTKRQKNTLKKHSVHHTKKHMNFMKKEMAKGSTFTQSHKLTLKKVGK
tara:strand:- start:157 stop:330 length:174 start_codon:yes stop_codon:yes gene_type:complete